MTSTATDHGWRTRACDAGAHALCAGEAVLLEKPSGAWAVPCECPCHDAAAPVEP